MNVIFLLFSEILGAVPHSILLDKLSSCGMREFVVCWVRSWLKGRAHSVPVSGAVSGSEQSPVLSSGLDPKAAQYIYQRY